MYIITKEQEGYIYANEAEFLNVAVFGITSKQWREDHPDSVLGGMNIRDLATIPQLTVLANLESYNSILIKEGLSSKNRLEKLKEIATAQLRSLSQYKYSYPIESPNALKYEQDATFNIDKKKPSDFDKQLTGILGVPNEPKHTEEGGDNTL